MLTMLNISGGFPMELYEKRKAKRNAKKEKKDGAAGPLPIRSCKGRRVIFLLQNRLGEARFFSPRL